MRTTVAALISGTTAAAVPWVAAAGYVVLNRGFEANDLVPFGLWSNLYGLAMVAVSWLLVETTLDLDSRLRYVAGGVIGLLAGVAFTVVVVAVLGPWMSGFGFPVLLLWSLGGVAALWVAVRLTSDVRT